MTQTIEMTNLTNMNKPVDPLEDQNSITFLNMSGDITITWDAKDVERKKQVIEMIRKKMKDGYVFFTVTKVPLLNIERKTRVSNKNIDYLNNVLIPDNEFDKLMAGIDDAEVAGMVQNKQATMVKRRADMDQRDKKMTKVFNSERRAKTAEEVAESQSLAFKALQGG